MKIPTAYLFFIGKINYLISWCIWKWFSSFFIFNNSGYYLIMSLLRLSNKWKMRLLKFFSIEFRLRTMVFLEFRWTDVKKCHICLPWRICKCLIEFYWILIRLSWRSKSHCHIFAFRCFWYIQTSRLCRDATFTIRTAMLCFDVLAVGIISIIGFPVILMGHMLLFNYWFIKGYIKIDRFFFFKINKHISLSFLELHFLSR